MGKKFVICEVVKVPFGEGYRPVVRPEGDPTWIDRRHVIDEDRLHIRLPRQDDLIFAPKYGWRMADHGCYAADYLILDPPKPEGDEWEKWISDSPWPTLTKDWFRRMPRKP